MMSWRKNVLQEYEIIPNIQMESSQNPKIQERTMKEKIRKLHVQKTIWKSQSSNSLCWVFFCE
jgi:hypothetical protein